MTGGQGGGHGYGPPGGRPPQPGWPVQSGQPQRQSQGQSQGPPQGWPAQRRAAQGQPAQAQGGWRAKPADQRGVTQPQMTPVAAVPPPTGPYEQTLIYNQTAAPETILQDIAHLRDLDKRAETKANGHYKWGCAASIAIIPLIFGTVLFVPAALLLLAAVILAVWQFGKYFTAGKRDVEDRRYELARRVLEVLYRDIDRQVPMRMMLNLRPSDDRSKQIGEGKVGQWNTEFYNNDWLWIWGTLLDGNSFNLTIRERYQKRSCWKRGASGKTKHKSKIKRKEVIDLRLKVNARKHPGLEQLAQKGRGAVKLPSAGIPKALTAKPGALRLKAQLNEHWEEPGPGEQGTSNLRGSTVVAMMFMSLYNIVKLARKLGKKQPA